VQPLGQLVAVLSVGELRNADVDASAVGRGVGDVVLDVLVDARVLAVTWLVVVVVR